ncbi:DUF308 domain-containing protein [Devosia albogilva]|uniref:DUF308 domain-containing protein n=1 Tax=Devosia albogilva TaxID=429726 RepID=A0ABW5QKH9_9HYPH
MKTSDERWLARYYFSRASFSVLWVGLALSLGQQHAGLGAALLLIYPLWDAVANAADASRNGGFGRNRTQTINLAVSLATTLAVAATLPVGLGSVLAVFGAWAILSGILQLSTALRRWRVAGAQWAMVLSGAQSALAGAFFIVQAQQAVPAVLPTIAGYAGFGALYFAISGISLALRGRSQQQSAA